MSTEKTRPTETQNSPSLSRTESNNESNAFDYNSFTISLKEVDVARLYRPDMSCEEFIRKITNETTWIKCYSQYMFFINYVYFLYGHIYGNIAISRLTLMLTYMIPVLLMLELLNNMYLKRFSKNHPSTFQEYNEASSFYISLNKIVQIYNKERYKTFFHDLFVFSN
ncbi:hypothetical protein WA158_008220 [Blastocystis sp. Blastoise]